MNWVQDLLGVRYNLKLGVFHILWFYILNHNKFVVASFMCFYACFVYAHCCVNFIMCFGLGFMQVLQVNKSFGLEVKCHFILIYVIQFMCVWTMIVVIVDILVHDIRTTSFKKYLIPKPCPKSSRPQESPNFQCNGCNKKDAKCIEIVKIMTCWN